MSTATDMLAKYQAAEEAVLKGHSYQWGDQQWTLANLPEIQAGRREFERRVAAEQRHAAGDTSPARFSVADFGGCS